jgi:hypothetical protein
MAGGEPFKLVKKENINIKMLLIIGGLVVIFFLFVYPSFKKERVFGMNAGTDIKNFIKPLMNNKEHIFGIDVSKIFKKENMDPSTTTIPEMPPMDMPQSGMPPMDMPQSGMPQSGMPPMDMPQSSMPPMDMSSMGMPTSSTEHFNYSVEPYEQQQQYNMIEHMNDMNETQPEMPQLPDAKPIELPEYIKKLLSPEHMANNTLESKKEGDVYKIENMSDIMKGDKMDIFGNISSVNNANIDNYKLENMMCSKACCSNQWGMGVSNDNRIKTNDVGSKFFSTNYMCSGDNPTDKGNGCVCVTKDMFSYLGNRGGNNTE